MNTKNINLPLGDRTPDDFKIEPEITTEKVKKYLRWLVYPLYTFVNDKILDKEYALKSDIGLNKVYLGQRGNDYYAHRRKINKIFPIKDKTILILGCGTARDIESWLKYKPKKIIGVDYFSYDKAWNARIHHLKKKYKTEIEFTQLDINNLYSIKDESIDIIGSDAVFEHLRHFKQSLQEVYRIMKQDSILYATYGPLWYSWGGDHISGVKGLKNGYQHLLLDKRDYEESLDDLGKFLHSENDGRTWIKNDLFSYLKPKEYLVQLEEVGFRLNYSSAIIDPRAIEFKKRFPHKYKILRKDCNFSDLAISGMTILCTK